MMNTLAKYLVAAGLLATVGCAGDQGPAGLDGSRGPQGEQGPQGPEGPSGPSGLPMVIQLPDADFFPEGIAHDVDNGIFYVGSLTTGHIVRAQESTQDGTTRAETLSAGQFRYGAVGMLYDAERAIIWACDANSDPSNAPESSIRGIDASTGELVATIALPVPAEGGSFCNDLVIDGDIIYVTDSFAGSIVEATIPDPLADTIGREWLVDDALAGLSPQAPFGANGIVQIGDYLWVVNSVKGTLLRIQMHDGEAGAVVEVPLTDAGGQEVVLVGPDGFKAVDQRTLIVAENFANRLTEIVLVDAFGDSPSGQVTVLASRLDGPTTFALSLEPAAQETAFVVEGQLDHLMDPDGRGPPALPFGVVRVELFLP